MKKKLFFIFILLVSCNIFSQEIEKYKIYDLNGEKYEYTTPSSFQFLTTLPSNGWSFLKNAFSFSDDNLKGWGAIILSSAILIKYDQEITDETQRFGRRIGIGNKENTVATMKMGELALLRRPSDVGSAMYFIGDGWITLSFAGAFMGVSAYTKDERAMTVGQELLQGLLLTGLTTQTIKRITGRESPVKSDAPGGKWRFFPSFKDYQDNTSKHDAFPSGHLASTMTTFMILSENYPEYKWINPVGYTLMTLLSFQMVNNSVHWAGDYPLALGIGYVLGKTIVDNGRKKVEGSKQASAMSVVPLISPDGKMGVNALVSF